MACVLGEAWVAVKPRLLDLFCGAGGAGMGYHRAGFEVIGIDIAPQPRYPFEFIQADALKFAAGLLEMTDEDWAGYRKFDAIHASPPCQAYTTMNNRHGSQSPALIADVRGLLEATGLPYVIENVPGAKSELHHPGVLSGELVGLKVSRRRLFETNWPLWLPYAPWRHKDPVAVYGKLDGRRLWTRTDGTELRACGSLEEAQEAMGIDWMTWDELREAIPPAYTELIGHQLMAHIRERVWVPIR